jgi:uncharacterized membrane protein
MRKWYPVVVIAVAALASIALYPRLPERVAVHWDMHGVANGDAPRLGAAVFGPLVMLGLWALMRGLPAVDPRRENYAKMENAYSLMVNATLTLLLVIHLAVLAAALGVGISMARLVPALIGALFIVIGYAMPQARPNWFFGIRTPWTLSNDRVWQRTHRVGGHLFVACGLVSLLGVVLPHAIGVALLVIAALVASFGSIAFSYIAWKQETSE